MHKAILFSLALAAGITSADARYGNSCIVQGLTYDALPAAIKQSLEDFRRCFDQHVGSFDPAEDRKLCTADVWNVDREAVPYLRTCFEKRNIEAAGRCPPGTVSDGWQYSFDVNCPEVRRVAKCPWGGEHRDGPIECRYRYFHVSIDDTAKTSAVTTLSIPIP